MMPLGGGIMPRCSGAFSEETKQQLLDEYRSDPGASLIKRCEFCGTSVVAENNGDGWVPETHSPPAQRVYKGAGSKRGSGKALVRRGAKNLASRFKKNKKSAATKGSVYKSSTHYKP